MPFYTDQLNRRIEINETPQRIISLVPSQTELLSDLGLEDEVTGITKFCIHPAKWFRSKQRIGGTKNINIEKIRSMAPDLIIANKEENGKEQVEELATHFPVWTSDVNNLAEAIQMIEQLGEIVKRTKEANALAEQISTSFNQLKTANTKPRTAYLIWKNPYMTIGGDTFINDMLSKAGFQNVFQSRNRYPAITIEDLQASGCQLLFLSSEPYPFKQKHISEMQAHLPKAKICLVDGEMFSWYGSRLQYAPAHFQSFHHQIKAIV